MEFSSFIYLILRAVSIARCHVNDVQDDISTKNCFHLIASHFIDILSLFSITPKINKVSDLAKFNGYANPLDKVYNMANTLFISSIDLDPYQRLLEVYWVRVRHFSSVPPTPRNACEPCKKSKKLVGKLQISKKNE